MMTLESVSSMIEAALPDPVLAVPGEDRRFRRSFPAQLSVFDGHYPGFPIVPGVLLIEAAAVAVDALVGSAGRWAGVQSARFQTPVRPDDEVVIDVLDDPYSALASNPTSPARVRVVLGCGDGTACTATLLLRSAEQADELGDADAGRVEVPGSAMEQIDIARLLPHRRPILLVDRVDEVVPGQRIRTRKAVSANEVFHSDKPTTSPFPWSLTLESWCQSAGVLISLDDPNPEVLTGDVMLFGGLRGVRFGRPALPGDVLVHEAQLDRAVDGSALLSGRTLVGGRVVMSVESITLARRPAHTLSGSRLSESAVAG